MLGQVRSGQVRLVLRLVSHAVSHIARLGKIRLGCVRLVKFRKG
jgi:hypothetical protein